MGKVATRQPASLNPATTLRLPLGSRLVNYVAVLTLHALGPLHWCWWRKRLLGIVVPITFGGAKGYTGIFI